MVLERSQLGGMMPVIATAWKSWQIAYLHCGTLVACVLVVRLVCCPGWGIYDWAITGGLLGKLQVLGCLLSCFFARGGMFGSALYLGNGSRGCIRESGERALVSICSIIFLTCEGSMVMRPMIGSRMEERLVGEVCCRFTSVRGCI